MRVYALSDLHVDYPQNRQWLEELADADHGDDLLILAGDISDSLSLLGETLAALTSVFADVLFVPGNHELWLRDDTFDCSLVKFEAVRELCARVGVHTEPLHVDGLSIVPLFSWYDFTFGAPDRYLQRAWRDFRACSWPAHLPDMEAVTEHFLGLNETHLATRNDTVISFSHFLPSLAVMPARIPPHRRRVYPVLGSERLGEQLRRLGPDIHVYGHSHVNQAVELDDILFVNNAFAYPDEERIARKHLYCVWDSVWDTSP